MSPFSYTEFTENHTEDAESQPGSYLIGVSPGNGRGSRPARRGPKRTSA